MGEKGKLVTLYWTDDRQFVQDIDGVKTILSPWVGIQIEEWEQNGHDWTRNLNEKYRPNDLSNAIKAGIA